jgi:hypothetical protein
MIDHSRTFRLIPRWNHAPRSDSYPIGQGSQLTVCHVAHNVVCSLAPRVHAVPAAALKVFDVAGDHRKTVHQSRCGDQTIDHRRWHAAPRRLAAQRTPARGRDILPKSCAETTTAAGEPCGVMICAPSLHALRTTSERRFLASWSRQRAVDMRISNSFQSGYST